ncbi:acetoacetate-CoA ligase [Cladophialophora psammophila CBS 110553]|uniref:Acetoacetate-CoA ligase n=1 Tax=Cladophialophora psammophila CBS 110553 TaxID=1182543 RepID=W9W0N1_9EURO|nr:acetoacetate-CoA ligase [Cladophialophora psammophila CBS 110553]EXJ61493.1 acetoacetate-CoA ligase [Cladophialophora psammophila CBS 110553]
MSNTSTPRILWQNADPSQTNMDKFRRQVNEKRGLALRNFADLHAWSTDPRTASDFWIDLFQYEQIKPGVQPTKAIRRANTSMYPPAEFFPDVLMNFAEHLLNTRSLNEVALYTVSEGCEVIRPVTRPELREMVRATASAMTQAGVTVGDRVAAVISNCVEAVVACLATLSLGAIWSTSSPDMGVEGIMQRLNQIEPKLVLFENSVRYNGKLRPLVQKYEECIARLRKTRNFELGIIIAREVPYITEGKRNVGTWDDFVKGAPDKELTFVQLPFKQPGFIVYSSGTASAPKCIVHSACAMLLQIKKDYMLHLDVRPGDTIYQYTTTGWIMWAMVLCGLSYGGSVVLYDGSPLYPDPLVTLRMIEKLKVTLFGTSARFLTDLHDRNLSPRQIIDLSSLRTVSSTGSVLPAKVCEWFYDVGFPENIHLVSGSGGTDMACSLVLGDPTGPFYSGEIQVPALGMAVDILDSTKDYPVSIKGTGEPGELVCREPFPSQPILFWGEKGMNKYRSAYFERFGDKIWTQGDFVSSSPVTGGFTMLGRSDGVLNPSGVRFGSAEIYNVVSQFPEFEDAICVGQRRPQDSDERVILFIKTKDNRDLSRSTIKAVRSAVAAALSPRHVPSFVFQTPEIPYTINGKKIELAVKQIVSGQKVTPSGAVENPESLIFYERFAKDEYLMEDGKVMLSKI